MTDTLETMVVYPIGIPIEVCDAFERIALEVKAMGYRRYSSDAILHRLRWSFRIDRGIRGFKVNDHWTAPLARWFMARHPEFPNFFELRERTGKAAEWIDHDD